MYLLTKSGQAQLANRSIYCLITRNIHFVSNNVHSARLSLLNRRFSITRYIAKVYLTILYMRGLYIADCIIFRTRSRANIDCSEVVQERAIIIIIIITLRVKLHRLIWRCAKNVFIIMYIFTISGKDIKVLFFLKILRRNP